MAVLSKLTKRLFTSKPVKEATQTVVSKVRTAPKMIGKATIKAAEGGKSVIKNAVPDSVATKASKPLNSRAARQIALTTAAVGGGVAIVGAGTGVGLSKIGSGVSDFVGGFYSDPDVLNETARIQNESGRLDNVERELGLYDNALNYGLSPQQAFGTVSEGGEEASGKGLNPVAALLGLSVLGLGGYWLYQKNKKPSKKK